MKVPPKNGEVKTKTVNGKTELVHSRYELDNGPEECKFGM